MQERKVYHGEIGFQLKYKKNMHRFNKNIVSVHTNTVNENKISHMSTLV